MNNKLAAAQAREKVLLAALRELMSYNPRMTYRGGVESGYMQPAGSAILSVLDKCDAALAQPADDTALKAALANERERCIAAIRNRTKRFIISDFGSDTTVEDDCIEAIRALGDA